MLQDVLRFHEKYRNDVLTYEHKIRDEIYTKVLGIYKEPYKGFYVNTIHQNQVIAMQDFQRCREAMQYCTNSIIEKGSNNAKLVSK
tara:strand:- start:373 stop:630 length:258 start_codon:yes stop_codon:yes gene_type:complete